MILRLKQELSTDKILILILFGFKASIYIFALKILTLGEALSFNEDDGFTLKSDGCLIPVMNLFERSIQKLVHYPSNLTSCPNSLYPLLENNQTHIWVMQEHFRHYRIKNMSQFNCCYKSFHRPFTFSNMRRADDRIEYLGCIMFHNVIEANNEFVKVECYNKNRNIYEQYFTFIPKKPFTAMRQKPFTISSDKPSYNVVILGLSSMSRLNFHRTMPHTYNFLTKLGSVELLGYHTAAENTYENIVPILTGMNNIELNITCWPNGRPLFDSCPLIWERFKDAGYYTAFLEDSGKSGIFNSGMFAFSGSPTDYYLHPFVHEAEKMLIKHRQNKKFKNAMRLHNETPTKTNKNVCIGNKFNFRLVLEYVESLISVLKSSMLFGIFWESSMGVDLNAPMAMDHGYKTLISQLNDSGYLNKTVLILMSDHGTNVGSIQRTKQGRLEERLPLVSILMPPSFREKYNLAYETIKVNSKKITTAFDLHETLIDLVNLEAVEREEISRRVNEPLIYERGMSLFLPLPSSRTCDNAGIKSQWCACHKTKKLKTESKIVNEATAFLVKHFNRLVKIYPQCARLYLAKTIEAEEMWPSYRKETEWRDFRVVVKLKPGADEYEVKLRRDGRGWSLSGTAQRLTDYNDQNHCMHDETLKPYCHCL